MDPLAAIAPMPWSMVKVVASLIAHFRLVDSPRLISEGVALKSMIAGGAGRQEMNEQTDMRARPKSSEICHLCLPFTLVICEPPICLIIHPIEAK